MSRPLDTTLERGPVATVPGMMNNPHVGELLDQLVADVPGAIFAAVVHHNDFKNWSQRRYGPIRLLNHMPDICRFVKCRKNDR